MPKVMLVEDDANILSLLAMLLEFEGFEVVRWNGCEDLDGLLEMARRERPALVFLDVHLRQLDGFDLLRRLKEEPRLQGMRILMASGLDLTYKCQQEGADGFILKPFMPEELIGKIQRTLG